MKSSNIFLRKQVIIDFNSIFSFFMNLISAKFFMVRVSNLYMPNGEGYVFISVGLKVCLLICSPVSNITGKHINRFSWNFQDILDKIQGTIWRFSRWYVEPLAYRVSFYVFSRKSVPVSIDYRKTDAQIFMKFLGKVRHGTMYNLEHFRELAVNPMNLRSIFLFTRSNHLDCFTVSHLGMSACLWAT